MTQEEILMRIGIDAQGVVNGMGRVSGFIKGQFTLLAEDLTGMAGRFLGVLGAERLFEAMNERVNAIRHAANSTGLSVELIQGIFNRLNEEGIDYEKIIRPLTQLSGMTSNAGKFLGDLAESYAKLNTQEERNAMLMNLGIKNWQALIPLLEEGREGVNKMAQPSWLKLQDLNIQDIHTVNMGFKMVFNGLLSAAALAYSIVGRVATNISLGVWTLIHGGKFQANSDRFNAIMTHNEKNAEYAAMEAESEKEGFTLAEKRAEMENNLNKLLEERAHLQDQIADRDKFSVDELAKRARELTGLQKQPRGLDAIYGVTPSMAAALRIQNLEDRAKQASAFGNEDLAQSLQSQADALRATRPELKSHERNPNQRVEEQLGHISEEIKFIGNKIAKFPTPP